MASPSQNPTAIKPTSLEAGNGSDKAAAAVAVVAVVAVVAQRPYQTPTLHRLAGDRLRHFALLR